MFFNAVEMPSLRETKDHIASVRGTLKITSAMKLVASAKLRKAQKQIETLRPYERELNSIYSSLVAGASSLRGNGPGKTSASLHPSQTAFGPLPLTKPRVATVLQWHCLRLHWAEIKLS